MFLDIRDIFPQYEVFLFAILIRWLKSSDLHQFQRLDCVICIEFTSLSQLCKLSNFAYHLDNFPKSFFSDTSSVTASDLLRYSLGS